MIGFREFKCYYFAHTLARVIGQQSSVIGEKQMTDDY